MKIKFTLLALAACCFFSINAQVMINESFNNPSTLTANGWFRINNSSPVGSTAWFTGNTGVFPALSSPDTSYIAANYNNTAGSAGTISNWLITPTVTVNNGGVLQFATRTNTVGGSQTVSPDRLEVYLSVSTSTTVNVGTTATSLGTFSTLVVAVNPGLTPTGYPTNWTVYTTTLTGITGTSTARFGFRYSVTSAGPNGTNSSYIGIDDVKYDLPCPNPTLTISQSTTDICSGSSFSIAASGATTYAWSSGQNTPSVTLSPTATTVYTLVASSIPNCNSTATVAITVTQTPVLSVLDVTTCPGTAATLVASGANSYSWSTGSTSPATIVTPTMTTTYTVLGANGNCLSSHVTTVTLGTSLSVNATSAQMLICSGKPTTITATGGTSYSYTANSYTAPATTSSAVLTPSSNTVYTITAFSGSCTGTSTLLISVDPSPTIGITAPAATLFCVNSPISFTATGGSSYLWSNSTVATSVFSTITPATAGTYTYGVAGTATNGCSSSTVVSRNVDLCTGVENISANTNKISVYPNPFTNEIKISDFAGSVEIYNALGQMIIKETINSTETLNTNTLVKGIYIMKAYSESDKLVSTLKIIKN